jgi:hypothetical protein
MQWACRAWAMQLLGILSFPRWVKERLLDLTVNVCEPIFRAGGTIPKMDCLRLKLACSFLGSLQLRRKLMREIHGPLAVLLCNIGSLLQQGNNSMSRVIHYHTGIRPGLIGRERNNRSWPFGFDAHTFPLRKLVTNAMCLIQNHRQGSLCRSVAERGQAYSTTIELGWLLHRQLGGMRALEDHVHVLGGAA